MEKPLQTLHRSLLSNNYDVPEDYDSFEKTLTAKGNEGYQNRRTLWQSLKDNNYDVPDDYETFSTTLFAPVKESQSTPAYVPPTQQKQAAAAKPQMQTASVQAPVTPAAEAAEEDKPEDRVYGTPWGSQGSAIGQSRAYKPFTPGQVRTTDDPDAEQFGSPYKPQSQLTYAQRDEIKKQNDWAARQIEKMRKAQARREQPLVDTGNEEVNQHIIKTQGEWDDELASSANRISSSVVVPAVDKAIRLFDEKAHEIFGETQKGHQDNLPTGVASGATIFGNVREANQAKDPEKVLQYLQQQMESVYKNSDFVEQIGKEADKLGIDRSEYLEEVIKPQIQNDLTKRFESSMIARELPKSGLEYVVSGLNNSIVGMIADTFLNTKSQRAYKNQAQSMTEEGDNPYYNPSTAASLAKVGVTFAADAPFFGVYGRVGGQVVKNIAEREIQNMMAKGLSESAARSIVGTALENSAGARMKNYIMQHVVSGAITMGGFNATSEGVRQVRDDDYNALRLLGSTAEGVATGAAFGLTGGAVQALSQPLSGFSKLGAKAAGFGAEAETMYATEEAAKALQGEDAFENPFEGSVESLMKLGVMKASSPGGIFKAIGEVAHPIKSNQRNHTGISFTPEEEAYVRSEGQSLLDALSGMHPERAISEVNGKKKLTKEGEQMRQQLAEAYNDFMGNTEIPANVKQKVAQTLGGVYRPGLETGADIIQNEDGSVVIKTRDQEGNCIQEIPFENYDQATEWQQQFKSQMSRNDATNMYNGASLETKQRIVDIVRDFVSGKSELENTLNRANGMRQNRMKRELEKYNQLSEKYAGREMTDEEARNYIQMVIKDGSDEVFNDLYNIIRQEAYPADELNTKRNYWEGRQMPDLDKHIAQVDAQLAEEQLMLLGEDFANEVMAAEDYPDEKMMELASRRDVSGAQLKAALDYYNKVSKLNGMMDETLKSIDDQVKAANAYVDRNTHPDSQSIIEVQDNDGKTYYVSAGHIQITPEGKLVGTDNTGMVILRDVNTGEIFTKSPSEVTVSAVKDPQMLKDANESMEGLRGELMAKANDAIDINPDAPQEPQADGDVFTGIDGKQYMTVAMQDEMGNTQWAKFELDEQGNPTGEPQPLDIAEYRKAKSDEIDAATMSQPGPVSEYDTPVIEPTETPIEQELAKNEQEQPVIEQPKAVIEQPETPQEPQSKIPVNDKQEPQFEQAKPEDTLAELNARYGEEKAQRMISQIAQATTKELEKLEAEDTSGITDMAKLMEHEDQVKELQQKRDYWNNLIKKEEPVVEAPVAETPVAETPVVETAPVVESEKPVTEKSVVKDDLTTEQPVTEPETPADIKPEEPETPIQEPEQPVVPEKSAQQKVNEATVSKNLGKHFTYTDNSGMRTSISIDKVTDDGKVVVTRQDFDADGKPMDKPKQQTFEADRIGQGIIEGMWKPVASTEERLRETFKGKVAMQNMIDVLSEEEQQRMLDTYNSGDQEAFYELMNEFRENHREDMVLRERDSRNDSVDRILNGAGSREDKLRRVRKQFQGWDDAEVMLSDEALQPTTLEEYVSDLHSRVPQKGEGQIAYYSYGDGADRIVGLQDETGFGKKSGADTKGFAPWLAPKGKGMSLQKYAETIHSQLPEAIQQQYSDQDVRNAILDVFGAAQTPSDIPLMVIRRGVLQAEQAARRMEEAIIDGDISYQKADRSFASRLRRAVEQTAKEPTEKQKEAGNYAMGHLSFGGYHFSVENPKGSIRRGTDASGKEWETKMNNTYGYILGKKGKDGDHLDMFINDNADLDNWNGNVYVVDQIDPKTGKFDESKILYGFNSEEEARQAYLSNYAKGWKGLGEITGVDKDTFDKWLDSSDRQQKEFAKHSIIKHKVESQVKTFDQAVSDLSKKGLSIDDKDLLDKYGLKSVTLSKRGDVVSMTHLVAEKMGEGNGTRFMNDLARLADEKGWTLALTPGLGLGAKSKRRLEQFYKRFGFVPNRGRNADFSTMEAMIRHPKEWNPEAPERQEQLLRDAVVDHLRSQGVNVSTDWQEGQQILDKYNGEASLSKAQKRALETVSIPEKEHQQTVVSSADGAKILKNLESFATKLDNLTNSPVKTFIGSLAKELEAKKHGSNSEYASFVTDDGTEVTIRLANHPAKVSNFDTHGEDYGISIVISNNKKSPGVNNDGDAHVIEYFYNDIKLRKSYGKPLADIVRAISNTLHTGEYKDPVGIAEREEVNADQIRQHKVYHGTGAEFDAFDHSHMGEGEGYQTYGYGTYVTEVPAIGKGYAEKGARSKYRRMNPGYGDNEVLYKGEKVDLQSVNPTKMAYDLISSERTVKKAINTAERLKGLAEDPEMQQKWQDCIDILKDSKKSDFKARKADMTNQRFVYDVEIPDDNGKNYLSWEGPYDERLTNGLMEKLGTDDYAKWAEQVNRLGFNNKSSEPYSGMNAYYALSTILGSPKRASEILSELGYVGMKYPTNYQAGGNKKGTKNYVIFNENDAKITDTMQFFKTPDGHAYGYTYRGKIYIDPRIATAETPIHEYSHLWAQAKRASNPEEWNEIKQTMLNDPLVQPIIDKVRQQYPELNKEGKEDLFAEEIITQFSGKRGNERLHEIAEEVAKENGGIFGKAEAVTAMQRLKSILNRFWEGVAKMMGWKYRNANQIADKIMADLLNGVDPRQSMRRRASRLLAQQKAETPIFISNAIKAVEGIKQEKGTPEQWLKMIEKGGGLKAGEDKWLGLSDWLNEQKQTGKSVTKQEVMNYIRQNQIQIEEENYREYFNVDDNPSMIEFRKEYKDLLSKYKEDRNAAWRDSENFNQEMYEKYGEGWANKQLDEEDKKRSAEISHRFNMLNDNDLEQLAFADMVDKHGDDFGMAFEINYGSGTIDVKEDMYGEGIPDAAKYFLDFDEKPIDSTRLSYTTDGLENKREIALTVPTIDPYNEHDEIHFGDAGGGRAVAWVRFGETTDADGNKVLVIDEIQSKRHQDAREKGYENRIVTEKKEAYSRANDELFKYEDMLEKAYQEYDSDIPWWQKITEEQQVERSRLTDARDKALKEYTEARNTYGDGTVPEAPFEKNWHELAMKRMLRYAAENGYDKIAWTTGDQQAERYSLSEAVRSVRRSTKVMGPDWFTLVPQGGAQMRFHVGEDGKIDRVSAGGMESMISHSLSELFGKDVAPKIEALNDNEALDFENQKIGGEGMKGFYDEILPRFMNKYGKKWSVKVGEINLPNLEESAQKMWSIDVTPEMRNSVMEGQPMFQKVAQVDANHKKAQLDIINSTNPMTDDIHLGIRSVDDIKSFDEAYDEAKKDADRGGYKEYASNPDVTNELLDNARKTGKIVVYSSKPIKNGNFVTPSEMMASDYAGEGRVYSKRVPLNDVAWINLDEGQYAKIDKKEAIAKRDQEYADAVETGDMEKVDAMLREEAGKHGYTEDSDYQGTSAFNGTAPASNDYYTTREERAKAFKDGNFEGNASLGDYMEAGIDLGNLDWTLHDWRGFHTASTAGKESIMNLRRAVDGGKKTITMYRSVPSSVKENSFRNGDWVTPSRLYAEENALIHDWGRKYRIIEQEVPVDDIWWDNNDINEWGYDDGKDYAYKNTKNNRKLLEPTYDKEGKLIPLSKRFDQKQDNIMYQLMGEKGAAEADKAEGVNTRQESLNIADSMEKDGKDSRAIKLATGWERGKDGKWRYETVDEKADILDDYTQKIVDYNKKRAEFHKEQGRLLDLYDRMGAKIPKRLDSKKYSEEEQIKFREMRKERDKVWKQYMDSMDQEKEFMKNSQDGHATKLVDLLGENHELFKYYPQLKDITVRYGKNMQQGVAGSYNDKDGIKISIDQMHVFGDNKDLNNDNLNGILVHEIQHAIQDIEGFAKGGNLYTATSEAGINAIVQKKQAEQAVIANKIDMFNKWLNNPEELKLISQLDRRTVDEEKRHLEEQLDDLTYQYDRIGMYIDKIKHDKAPAMSDARDLYSRLAGEVEARNASERINMSEEERRKTPIEKTEDYARENQVVMMEYPESGDEGLISFQKVDDTDELKKLESEPTVKRYRAMQMIDGKLYPPMSAKVNGQMRQPTEIGVWEKAEERPDLVKNGKFVLNKAQKGQSNVPAAYNPYFHTSTSGLNDQFTSAYKRPELVVVEVEIPESELTSGYKAEGAKDAVGNVDWHSGVVNGQLPADRQRQVTLSRYSKVNRVVPDSEVADMIAKQLDGTNIEVPYNVVTPSLRAELEKKGVTISDKPAGSVTEDINGNPIRYQRVGEPESELTPEERQYWNKWDADMKKWRERNAIPEGVDGPGEKPRFQQGESALAYAQRLMDHNRAKALWQTAPKLEDYRQKREDKDILQAARENEQRYPDSPSAKMRRVAAELQQIRHAMSQQKAYDKATVKAVTDFAQDFMKMGFGDNLSRGEMERMLSSVKNATGAKDIKREVDNILNILMDNHLRNLDQRVQKLSSVKELSKTAQGVEKQGKLELKGQRMIQAFREAREGRMDAEKIRERMNEVAEKMARNDEEAPMWEQEYEGLSTALQYAENIEASRDEWAELDREYKDAVKNYKTSGRSYKAQQELLESLDQAMMENKIERIGMFGDIIGRLEGNIAESVQGAKEFREKDAARIQKLYAIVNSDLAGKETRITRREGTLDRILQNDMLQLAFAPLGTFEQMLKQIGGRNVKGEGNTYNYLMNGYMDAVDNTYTGQVKVREELDAKAREIFGDKVKRWTDLYDITMKPGAEVTFLDGDKEITEQLSQGNMLYIYMANKMSDGKMKLRKMGITDEDVDAIKEALDPRLVQLGDWLQSEYLPQKRIEYNKVHERMFGAPMAAVENYFPIKVNRDAAFQDAEKYMLSKEGDKLPSAITGSIIKRTKNTIPLDILHTDAISLALEHLNEMEQWKSQAEWNRDVKDLLSYTTFRNKVKNMKTIYGSGTTLWNKLFDAATIATGDYDPKRGVADKTISNIAKGVTSAKINFRIFTALKQLLSIPAFFHDTNTSYMAKAMLPHNYFYNNFKWAIENMPVFRKRWESRQIGDTRLMDDPSDWKIWKKKWMEKIQKGGMAANATIDALTCAAGAKAIYESRYKQYKEIGASDEIAHKQALKDAEIGYNLTQQSSEGAFVSTIQKDRTVAANALSVFRNGPFAYTRQAVDAIRNLSKMVQKGYKEDSIEFMTNQFKHKFNITEEQAKKAAEMEYAKAGRHEVAKLLNMMFGVTALWNLGAPALYLFFGDDDKTKKEMATDAIVKSLAGGPVEGLAGGNIWSDIMGRALSEETRRTFANEGLGAAFDAALKQAGDYEVNPLPLMADIQSMIKKLGYDKYAAAQDVFNIAVQSYTGVNPQTITDIWNAAMDYGNPSWMPFTDKNVGNEDLSNSKEIALFIMRVLNAPTSAWRNKYIDELGMNAEDAKKLPYDEMAKRYANYKHWKDAPIMGWLRSDEARQAKMEKIQEQFDKKVMERMERLTDAELQHNLVRSSSPEEKRMYAKIAAQRLGLKPGADSKKPDTESWYQYPYQKRMTYEDIKEDETLEDLYSKLGSRDKKAKSEIDKRLDWIRDGKYDSENGRKGKHKNPEDDPELVAPGKKQFDPDNKKQDEAIMANIRKWRKEALEIALKAEAE